MIFEVEVHNTSAVLSLVGKYLVRAKDAVEAGTKALKAAQKDNFDKKPIYVKNVRELDGAFVK
jgi:hypothetical protein